MGLKRSKDGAADPMQVVSRFLDAANHHDADALRACVHHDFESIQPIHPGRNFRGSGQLISNWKAIFEAEPGFRLTVLRSAVEDDTVWVEVHGAGDSAEAAGIFIVGVEDGRIRWIRVYSDLVEPAPEVAPAAVLDEAPEVAAAELTPAAEAAEGTTLEPATVTDGDGPGEAFEAPYADDERPAAVATAVGDEADASEGRPLRLVEAAEGEFEADGDREAGAAAALRLVADGEPGGPDGLQRVETGELLDVEPDATDENEQDDEALADGETTAGPAAAPDAADSGEAEDASEADQIGDEAPTATTDGEGGLDLAETTTGTVEGETVESPTEEPDAPPDALSDEESEPGPGAATDAHADEVVEPSSEEADALDVEVSTDASDASSDGTDDEVVVPASDEADAAPVTAADDGEGEAGGELAETSDDPVDEDTADPLAAADAADPLAAADAADPLAAADGDGFAGDRQVDDEAVTTDADAVDAEPPAERSGRGGPELAEPTSPPLPRVAADDSPSPDEEAPSWRRMWRRMRGPTDT